MTDLDKIDNLLTSAREKSEGIGSELRDGILETLDTIMDYFIVNPECAGNTDKVNVTISEDVISQVDPSLGETLKSINSEVLLAYT